MQVLETKAQNQIEQKPQQLQVTSNSRVSLRNDDEGQKSLVAELYQRFETSKLYGKSPEAMQSIVFVFLRDLSEFPVDRIMKAIQTHAQRSDEFPTVADIYGLIKRNGRPPVTEAMYVTASRKDGADRTAADWDIIRDFENDRMTGWADHAPNPDEHRQLREEIDRLRREVASLWDEKERAWAEVRKYRQSIDLKPQTTMNERVEKTIAAMKEAGAPQEDIDAFKQLFGG